MPVSPHLRVFISSPGDVADERNLARRLLKEELPYRPFLRGRIEFEVVSWDDPAARVPILATLTPQESVNRGMPKPSACDVVVVVLWGRMGTPLPDGIRKRDGTPYLSGTEWEYEDAVNADPKPNVWVFRRTPSPLLHPDDPKFDEQVEQYRRVQRFFDRFTNFNGSLKGGYTTYDTPSAFKSFLMDYFEALVDRRLKETQAMALPETGGTGAERAAPVWQGSPYPGLRAFEQEEAAIFFGRGRETDALIARLRNPDQRFLAVIGASGSGKSSLVRAGLLPRLQQGAIEGSRHWRAITFTPDAAGKDPFLALAVELARELPPSARKPAIEIAETLAHVPQRITEYATTLLAGRPAGAALVLVVDQLEELFALAATSYRAAFLNLLARAAGDSRLLVLTTLRADFLSQAVAEPALRPLLQTSAGTYPLAPPDSLALAEMTRRPAERAGLEIEDDVVHEVLKDAGTDPGALPLVAFCLEELYRSSAPTHRLTAAAYNDLGRLRGAIGRRAEALLSDLRETEGVTLDAVLPTLFHVLVQVDVYGTVTRRRTFRDELATDPLLARLIETLVQGRLLRTEDTGGRATITAAHEALFDVWPELKEWIERNRDDLTLVAELEAASLRWHRSSEQEKYLIPPVLLADITALQRRSPDLFCAAAQVFVAASQRAAEKEEIVCGRKALSKDEIDIWLHTIANSRAAYRRVLRNRSSNDEEMQKDAHAAELLFAGEVIDGHVDFAIRIDVECYPLFERLWLNEIKQFNANMIWEKRHYNDQDDTMYEDYLEASKHVRDMLVNKEIKSQSHQFLPLKHYIESNYLRNGEFNSTERPNARDLVIVKANRIHEMTGSPDSIGNFFNADTYCKLFYNNIIPASMSSDEEATLLVLKALQFSKAPENSFAIISVFEALLSIYFLNPYIVMSLWERSESYPLGESVAISSVNVDSWPDGYEVPVSCRKRLFLEDKKLLFRGVMTQSQLHDLEDGLEEQERSYVRQLFEKSRLIHRCTTL